MSTRATYEFINNTKYSDTPPITFYIHHDGYCEGAAVYFWNMHQAKAKGNCKAARFLIGNAKQAEFTRSHHAHGDTEYQYTLENEVLTVKKVSWNRSDPESGTIVFQDTYEKFINQYLHAMFGTEYNKPKHYLYRIQVDNCERVVTLEEMIAASKRIFANGVRYKEDNPNRKAYLESGQAWRNAADNIIAAEKYGFEDTYKIDPSGFGDE